LIEPHAPKRKTAHLPLPLEVAHLYGRSLEIRRQAMDEVIDPMTFYNHHSIHSALDYVSLMQFEKSWHTAQLLKAAQLDR
jgi:putative transposase